MVSARSTIFLLIFILLTLRFSNAHIQHKGKNTLVVGTEGKLETTRSPVKVEIYHGVPAVAENYKRKRFLLGRKIMSRGVHMVESENGIDMAKGLTTKQKARGITGKCNHEEKGRGTLSLNHKFGKRKGHYYTKIKMSSLVPLNADYYVPRPHPPKNN